MAEKRSIILYILKILLEYSDEDHPLKQKEIIQLLEKEHSISIDRKSISPNIEALSSFGFDIETTSKGIYILRTIFDETQIQYLIDAVYSSKSISGKDSDELNKILTSFLSKYQRQKYSYIKKSSSINRSENNLFYNISLINDAIKTNKAISFQYLQYSDEGKLKLRTGGYRYHVSPYYLINNFGKYYLLGKYYNSSSSSTYRLDYMIDIKIEEEKERFPEKEVLDLGPNFKISDYINDHIYVFSGEVITSTIEIKNDYVIGDVIDWFGTNAKIYKNGDKILARIKCNKNALLYWALQYLEGIKIISPRSLQNDIIALLKRNLEKYEMMSKENDSPLNYDFNEYLEKFIYSELCLIEDFKNIKIDEIIDYFLHYITYRNEKELLSPSINEDGLVLIDNKKKYQFIFKHYFYGLSKDEEEEIRSLIEKYKGKYDNTFIVIFNKFKPSVKSTSSIEGIKLTWRAILGNTKDDWHKFTIIKI